MPFWSKSQEKPASEADSDRVPEPNDEPKPNESEASTTAPTTTAKVTDKPAPEDEVNASAPSESTWGSRFNTAKQLYGTANQVYTVASAIPQARTALEPYLTKASTTEDPESKTEPETETTESTQQTSDIPKQPEKGIADLPPATPAVDETKGSETQAQLGEGSDIKDDATGPISESSPAGESTGEHVATRDITEPQDTAAPESVTGPAINDEVSADAPAASKSPNTEADTTQADQDFTKPQEKSTELKPVEDSSSSGLAAQNNVIAQDASPHAETTPRNEALETSDLESKGEKLAKTSTPEDAASKKDASPKNTSAQEDVSAGSDVNASKEPTKAFRKGLVFAREKSTEDSPLKEEGSDESPNYKDTSAVESGAETKEDVLEATDKSNDLIEEAQPISAEEPSAPATFASDPVESPEEKSTDRPEVSSSESTQGLPESSELPKSERPVSPPETDTTSAPGTDTKHEEASTTLSQPTNDHTEANEAVPASLAHQDPGSEENSAGQNPLEPSTSEDTPIELKDTTETAEQTSDPSSTEAQPAADTTSNPADAQEPDDAAKEKQPTAEEIEKAADAAKAAARLQSTADTLWAQARAVRDPAERERLWRAAYNKEVEAHGQSKKARAMASGWGQGALSGVGLSSMVGVGLGNVVGALLSGVVSVPGSLIGAGVGAAMGPLVKLGGYATGGKKENSNEKEKDKENDRPKEFDWEEDLSDDEEHRKIVDAVRMDEEGAEAVKDTKDE